MLSSTYTKTTTNSKQQLQNQVIALLKERGMTNVEKNPIQDSSTRLKNRYGLVIKG